MRRFELPVKILLIDNQRLGMVRQWQELFYDRRYSQTDLGDNPDFVMLASAYGIRSERVDDTGELRDALERFLRPGEPALLHCACFPAENVWPLIPPGATVDDAMEFAPVKIGAVYPPMPRLAALAARLHEATQPQQ